MKQWEYTILSCHLHSFHGEMLQPIDDLAELGEDGWELVSTILVGGETHFYFKRPKTSLPEASIYSGLAVEYPVQIESLH